MPTPQEFPPLLWAERAGKMPTPQEFPPLLWSGRLARQAYRQQR